ncbi:hypothetical protein A2230_01535 [candidate division WOR-1 bacterium RIFOXYA2_FULL_36_21]|uniref:Methicillin resistance protein n=1 Tax=candidate division WOR-1 bacterium RIFOXYB2_FULL_36_35 TaxID=1802578 RepID=A0A1F4S7D7_UNCSA|nr:MAG: hypothetical protein A2230_01535 [candidate division WOR-1 bacterium RIFOXYA2_FULL_36_21]OGC15706.1 MAG: hypothetical protein A2282_04510 [candidate division WOR-1 bacterium RIFOXYA12_FULL_36_13]OGC16297.1 MAG: hypothetical protein A2290_04260 [candidate division WOR-1 bacterium RIFOXYB2_FULL_36_35]
MQLLTNISKESWNDFVAKQDEPAILQSWEWGELKALHGWTPIRLAVLDGDKIVAAISILKRKLPYIKLNLFYAPRGPIVDFQNTQALDFILAEMKKVAKKHNAILLKIDPQVKESEKCTVNSVQNVLKEKGFVVCKKQIQPRSTFIVDLTLSSEDLLKSFEEKTRYNIRLAAKKGVVVKELSTDDGVEVFYKIYQETCKRDNFLIHPLKYYQNIKKLLVDHALANIFIAYLNEAPIAAVYTFNFGSRLWYMYGASLSKHRNVMPNHALHWHIIQWAKKRDFKSYDLFGIPSNPTKDHPLWGVYRFKKGFNGELVKYIGVYDLVYNPLLYKVINIGITFYKSLVSLIRKGKISDSLSE